MIQFTDLRVTKDGKKLIIGAKVKEASYYDNVYIDKVIIDTEETFVSTGPSSDPIYSKDIHNDYIEDYTFSGILYEGEFYEDLNSMPNLEKDPYPHVKGGLYFDYSNGLTPTKYTWNGEEYVTTSMNSPVCPKEIYITLEKNDLNFTTVDNHLFYIYIVAGGIPDINCPCGGDNQTTLGVTMYTGHYYNDFMNYIREMEDDCNIPQGLIDYILRYKVLVNSINTGHFTQANTFFNKWFKNGYHIPLSNCNCGCYG